MDVLLRVVPFFLLIGLGAVVGRVRLIDLAGARVLSAYVFWVAFPALLLHSLAHTPPPDARFALQLGVYGLAAASPFILAVSAGRLWGWNRGTRAGAGMASIGGNTAFLGAPLAVSLFGAQAAIPAAAIVAMDCTLLMALATGAVRGAAEKSSPWRALSLALKNPLVIAAVVGVGMGYAGLVWPGALDQALAALRATASPVGLVALGIVVGLEFGRPRPEEAAPVLLAVFAKTVVAPLLVWLALGLAGADPLFRAVATLLAACPTAVNVFIQTRTYGVFARGGAMTVVLATLVTAITLPLIGAVLKIGL